MSANNFNGLLIKNPSRRQSGDCKIGGCLQFDGTNYVQLPDLRNRVDLFGGGGNKGAITISAWIKPTNVDDWRHLANGFPGFLYFGINPSRYLQLMVSCSPPCRTDGNTNYWPISTGRINLNEWNHVTFILEGGKEYRMYINGVLDNQVKEQKLSIINMGGEETGLGRSWGSGTVEIKEFFRGYMDEMIVFNRALSDNEVNALYSSQK